MKLDYDRFRTDVYLKTPKVIIDIDGSKKKVAVVSYYSCPHCQTVCQYRSNFIVHYNHCYRVSQRTLDDIIKIKA
jgi:hypothetical protein